MTLNALLTVGPRGMYSLTSRPPRTPLHSDVPGVSEAQGPFVWFCLFSFRCVALSRQDHFLQRSFLHGCCNFRFDTWEKNRRRCRQKIKHFRSFLFCCVLLCSCAVQLLAVVRHTHTRTQSHTHTDQVQVVVLIYYYTIALRSICDCRNLLEVM